MSIKGKTTLSIFGIVAGTSIGWLSFWYFETKTDRAEASAVNTRVSVLEEAVKTIKDDNKEMKGDIKAILKAVK